MTTLHALLSQLVYWHWLAVALLLGIVDVIVGANFFFVWCGVSAGLVGLVLWIFPAMSWEYQFLLFGIGVMASLVLWRQYWKKYLHNKPVSTLNQRGMQYVGREFTLEEPIVNGRGKARVEDTQWLVQGADMAAGEKVRVIGVDGVVLKVEKA